MQTYIFRYRVEPGSANPNAADLAGAYAVIMALSDNEDSARKVALHHLAEGHWIPVEAFEAEMVSATDCDDDPVNHALYLKAQRFGVGMLLSAWPR